MHGSCWHPAAVCSNTAGYGHIMKSIAIIPEEEIQLVIIALKNVQVPVKILIIQG